MTILFLTRRFYPFIGGVEKHVMEISKRLVKDHTVIVVTEAHKGLQGSTKTPEIINGIKVYRIPTGPEDRWKKFRIWSWLWKNQDLIRQSDLIHCHDVFFWYLPFRFLFPNKPVYTTFHGYEGYPVSQKAKLIRKLSEKLSFGNICVGDYIHKWYGTKPDYITYGAVEMPQREVKGLKVTNAHSALFFGRLDEQTGIITYVNAYKKIKKLFPKFKFLVIGDGKYKRKIDKSIKMLGFKINPEKFLKDYHFAFVSRYLSTLEAMAEKKLVFCIYDNPLKADCFKLSPFRKWIVLTDNEDELVEKVIYYINHPKEEKKLTEEAYEWVKNQSWEKMVKMYFALWKKPRTNRQK